MIPGLQLAYIGTVVPDILEFNNIAFVRSGNMFQTNYISALRAAGLPPSLILSQRPARAFPHTTTLFYLAGKSPLEKHFLVNLMPFINVPVLRPITIGLAVLLNLLHWGWCHRDTQDKVVITYNLTEPPGFFTLIGAKLIGAKAVAHISDINVPGETVNATVQRRFDFWMQKRLIPMFDGITVVSDRIVHDFAPTLPYLLVECGVSDELLDYVNRHSNTHNQASDRFIIASAGSLNEANGFLELLDAFSMLKGDKYRLRIAGRGPLEGVIRQAALADSRIEFFGYLPFEEVMALYMSADVLVNMRITQRINTKYFFPSKTMEYLITGVPVIMTQINQANEDYARIAFLLEDENAHALAKMIDDIATMDPVIREKKGKAAQEYIRLHHSWSSYGQQMFTFLNALFYTRNNVSRL